MVMRIFGGELISAYSQPVPNMIYSFLDDLGYSGALSEKLYKYQKGLGIFSYEDLSSLFKSSTALSGVLSNDKRDVVDQTIWTNPSGTATFNDNSITIGNSSRLTCATEGPFTGEHWVVTKIRKTDNDSSGTYRPRFLSPTYQPESTRQSEGNQIWKFPDLAGSTTLDLVSGGTFEGDLEQIQVIDMDGKLDKPFDIYIAMGQSLMASSTSSTGLDLDKDGWTNDRCYVLDGRTYSQFGATRGEIRGLCAPLQMGSNDASVANCIGLSPAHSFGNEIVKFTDPDRNVLIIASAISGTGLTASDAPWNHAGTDPYAYDAAVALCTTELPTLPVGSTFKGVIWAQGEADTSADMSDYPAAFASMRSAFETAISSGELPWVIITAPPNATRLNQAHFIETQMNMDENSGHASAQSKVYSVKRPPANMEDSTHPDADNQRIAGIIAAHRMAVEI